MKIVHRDNRPPWVRKGYDTLSEWLDKEGHTIRVQYYLKEIPLKPRQAYKSRRSKFK